MPARASHYTRKYFDPSDLSGLSASKPRGPDSFASSLASLMAGMPEAERAVRGRELRELALVDLGLRDPATFALVEAIADPAAGPRTLALLDTVPALPRWRLLSAYGALMASSGR